MTALLIIYLVGFVGALIAIAPISKQEYQRHTRRHGSRPVLVMEMALLTVLMAAIWPIVLIVRQFNS